MPESKKNMDVNSAGLPKGDRYRKHESFESDLGETEDEEVKRTCMLGISGLRDSDFSDSDEEIEEKKKGIESKNSKAEGEEPETLVQFVSGGKIPTLEGLTLFRPTPIAPKLATHYEAGEEDSSCSDTEEDGSRLVTLEPSKNAQDENASLNGNDGEEGDGWERTKVDSSRSIKAKEAKAVCSESDQGGILHIDNDKNDSEIEDDCASVVLAVKDLQNDVITDAEKVEQVEQEPSDDNFALVGASGASVDEKWPWFQQKRVLSSNTLAELNREAGRNADSPKRKRSHPPTEPPPMLELSLGEAAFEQFQFLPRHLVMRNDSRHLSSDDDDEEDRMMSEELENNSRDCSGDNSPIPLLTPPHSPRREDEVEWPSNLVVDSALMNSVTDMRALSPASLEDLGENEGQRLKDDDVESSTLTPLLRSIYVGTT